MFIHFSAFAHRIYWFCSSTISWYCNYDEDWKNPWRQDHLHIWKYKIIFLMSLSPSYWGNFWERRTLEAREESDKREEISLFYINGHVSLWTHHCSAPDPHLCGYTRVSTPFLPLTQPRELWIHSLFGRRVEQKVPLFGSFYMEAHSLALKKETVNSKVGRQESLWWIHSATMSHKAVFGTGHQWVPLTYFWGARVEQHRNLLSGKSCSFFFMTLNCKHLTPWPHTAPPLHTPLTCSNRGK